ncbi:MAG: radical SAM protein [Gallintestinimicrobium sp.]
MELYLHIPFCRQKCRYCDFCRHRWQQIALQRMVTFRKHTSMPFFHRSCRRVSFIKSAESLRFSGAAVRRPFARHGYGTADGRDPGAFCVADDAEITLESNPGTLDFEKLAGYRRAGINRLSMGLQSACDKELAMLGRIHNFDTFVQNYKQARRAGFENINVDLMSALPGQTVESWGADTRENCRACTGASVGLQPDHRRRYAVLELVW